MSVNAVNKQTGNLLPLAGIQTYQFATMPPANSDNLNKIIQYVGTTTSNYINGYFYKCVFNDPSYIWENIAVNDVSISGAVFKGSILFANLPTTGMENGDWYDIKDTFTTDNRFEEGSGIACAAGTDVIWVTTDNKWNILTPSGVYSFNGRTGAVSPTIHDYDADQIDYDNTTSSLTADDVQEAIDELNTKKVNKVSNATNGNFAGLDSNGNLTDSGSKASDFLTSIPTASTSTLGGVKIDGNTITIDANGVISSESDGGSSEIKSVRTAPTLNPYWTAKTWNGLTNFNGAHIWTDGENIYYSNNTYQYVLDKSTSTWSTKTWVGVSGFYGSNVWTDGENIYYSYGSTHKVLNKSTSTWSTKAWTGLLDFYGGNVWTDGENIYYSYSSNHKILNKSTSTWSTKTWTGLTNFYGADIWTDGENIYHSYTDDTINQYVLNIATSTWFTKTWTGLTNFSGGYIWTDGNNIYYSDGSNQYVLNKETSTWTVKVWNGNGLSNLVGNKIWTDGSNIYYSNDTNQYILEMQSSTKKLMGTADIAKYVDDKIDKVILSINPSASTITNYPNGTMWLVTQ